MVTIIHKVEESGLDPLLVSEIREESLKWGWKELLREVEKYDEVTPVISPRKENSPAKTVVVGKVRETRPEEQLVVQVYAELPSGKGTFLRALIDTGAEACLVREGLLASGEFSPARERLFLTTANGQRMRGGDKSVKAKLNFAKTTRKGPDGFYAVEAEFYEADINVDAILGYPWMVKRHIGVLPYRRALSVEEISGGLNLLTSVEPPGTQGRQVTGRKLKKKERRRERRINRVRSIPFGEDKMEGWVEGLEIEEVEDGEQGDPQKGIPDE